MSWFPASSATQIKGMFPASTMPMTPTSQILCRMPTGQLAFCQSHYQIPGGYPGQYPGAQYPGAGGQFPGAQYPGYAGQYPGAQYPGQFPGAQYPGAGGQYPGAGGGQYPGWPPAQPAPAQPAPVQPAPVQPAPVQPAPPTSAVVAERDNPSQGLPPGASQGQCGVSRYYPIRYTAAGVVAEEL